MATGGFSTKNASIGHYGSAYIEYVIIFFMMVAGTNFALHYRFLRGELKAYFRSRELRLFLGLIAGATLFIIGDILLREAGGAEWALRKSLFQVAAILTTTGYGTADYEQWSFTSQFILFLFMFVGGCAGSTGGGMKILRFYVLIQMVRVEVKRLLHPSGVLPVRVGGTVVPREIVTNILGFFILMIVLFIGGVALMTLLGLDLVSGFGAVAACLGNIGPGLGSVGPTDNYAHIPIIGKWILAFFMLVGRLEIYTVLILFAPSFWRK
jgi:trk system potassium uptake protein TrkH